MFVVITPRYDLVCKYGALYFGKFDGSDEDCLKLDYWGVDKKFLNHIKNSNTLLVTGHGTEVSSIGENKTSLFDETNISMLYGKVCFFPVCLMGQKVGQDIGKVGTFIGYVDEFVWLYSPDKNPENDNIAAFFWNVQLSIARDILNGLPLCEIKDNAFKYYDCAIQDVKLSKYSDEEKKKIIGYLYFNRNNFVVYGNTEPIKQNYTL